MIKIMKEKEREENKHEEHQKNDYPSPYHSLGYQPFPCCRLRHGYDFKRYFKEQYRS